MRNITTVTTLQTGSWYIYTTK